MNLEVKEQNWRLWVSYDGTKYCGWQMQPLQASIEETLQNAFYQLVGYKPVLTAAGRTDSGVHARGQAVSVQFSSRFDEKKILLALESKLPNDIAVWRADVMPEGFNAKRHSIGKCYVYRIYQGPVKDPFSYLTYWHLRQALNVKVMQHAAGYFLGEHDFESFRSAHCDAAHARRYLWRVEVRQENQHLEIEIRGNAFCHNMVRIMVGTLVEVGLGRIAPTDIEKILQQKDRKLAGRTAPAHALCLEEVYYPDNLENAKIPDGACFPRFPVTKDTWGF